MCLRGVQDDPIFVFWNANKTFRFTVKFDYGKGKNDETSLLSVGLLFFSFQFGRRSVFRFFGFFKQHQYTYHLEFQ